MAYTVNGKVFTDHPLMDEIVHNTKLILNKIVVKNEELANQYEDATFYPNVETRRMIVNHTITFSVFPFTLDILMGYGYDYYLARAILTDRNNAPLSDRESLLSFASQYFIEHYEEQNKYYRMLLGLPEYGTDEYDIYITEEDLPDNVEKEGMNFSVPIHQLDKSIISILQYTGKINELIEKHKGFNYSYLRYLGDNAVDLDTARNAGKFEILYLPIVEELVSDRFRELYNLNREIYLKHTYSDAYKYMSNYYDEMIILMLLAQTFNDMIVDVPEWYIRRDIFDLRSVRYFLDSYGVAFYKEIPLKYQIRIVKNLNKLIKYKSSDKNFEDIINDIFSSKNTSIYEFFLFKKLNREAKTEEEKYQLEFVKSKIQDSYDDYIKDLKYRTSYDEITYQDKYWDGELDHQFNKDKHLGLDFTIRGTKYKEIEYYVSMSEYLFQMEYFWGLVLDSNIDLSDIKIGVPSIDTSVMFKLTDLYLLLYLMTLTFDNCSTNIILPEKTGTVEKPEFTKYDDYDGGYSNTPESEYDPVYSANGQPKGYLAADGGSSVFYSEIKSQERFYDWMRRQYPEMFTDHDQVRQYRFNSHVDLEALEELVERRHSKFAFEHGFTLQDFGVDQFIKVNKIDTIDQLVQIYFNNKECYNNLKVLMTDKRPERDTHRLMQYVFRELFTAPFDYQYYTIKNGTATADKLENLLLDKDYILYTLYMKLKNETNLETRRDNIRAIMNDIINVLEFYLSEEGLEYIFGFTTIGSFDAIVKYIYLIINFFKSYKVYFLDPYVTYDVSGVNGKESNKLEFDAYAHDTIGQKIIQYLKWDKQFAADNAQIDVNLQLQDDYRHEGMMEVLDVYGHFDPDPEDDYDYNGKYADTDEPYKDANGGYADDKSCIPFIMLNGGDSSGGQRSMWDLDGASAREMQEYYDVDAGYAYDEEDYYHDYYHTAFRYILDGGSAGTNQFITRTLHTQIIDNQITTKIRVSNYEANNLVVKEDGLYLEQAWTSWTDFNNLVKDSDNTFDYFTKSYTNLLEIVQIAGNPEILDQKIQTHLDNKLYGAREAIKFVDTSTFERDFKSDIDLNISRLYQEFYSYSPFAWEEF